MNWLLFALLSVLGTTFSNIYRRISMDRDNLDPVVTSIVFQFLGAFMIGSVAFIHGFKMPPIAEYPVNFLLNGFLWGIATLLLFKTYQYLEASEATILVTLEAIVAIIASILFLNEQFNLLKVIGTILIISAVIFISYNKKKVKINKGVFYAMGYSVFAGLGITNDAFLTHKSDPLSFLTIAFLLPGIFILVTQFGRIKLENLKFNKTQVKSIILLTFFYAFAAAAWFLSIASGGQASQITPINQSSIILTIILATIFLKERKNISKKIICAIIVGIGVILLA